MSVRCQMAESRIFAAATVAVGLLGVVHAVVTWPARATLALFAGGALVAFVAEAVVSNLGWLEHHVGPALLGVPLYVLFGWTGVVYAAFRLALLVTDGWSGVALGAAVATTYDFLADHRGVARGYWTYTDDIPGPRVRSVPWWNFVGWLLISVLTASFALPFL